MLSELKLEPIHHLLYMICEIKKFDATFFPEKAVRQCLDAEHAYPKKGMQSLPRGNQKIPGTYLGPVRHHRTPQQNARLGYKKAKK
ncbi:MAG: hypothetical protein U9P79_08985 [Candidatus Cloacimonadota bacterium]|nr:hypothetical protein [Candidatus Cloacimonadota bacterium]